MIEIFPSYRLNNFKGENKVVVFECTDNIKQSQLEKILYLKL